MTKHLCYRVEIKGTVEELLEERVVSGTGVLRVPQDKDKLRYVSLVVDVIRPPSSTFLSFKYDPPRQRYATLVFLRSKYVIAEMPLDYEKRRYDFVLDQSGQSLIATKCAYEGTLQTFFNLGNALSLPSISITNLIKDFTNLDLLWDEVHVVCEAGAGIQLRLFGDNYETCNDDAIDRKKPPPPPPPHEPVPPNTPLTDISPPYDDDPDTAPEPIDVPDPDAPVGEPCDRYKVTYTYVLANPFGAPVSNDRILTCYAMVGQVSFDNLPGAGSQIKVECQGRIKLQNGAGEDLVNYSDGCGTFGARITDQISLGSATFPILSTTIVSVVPAP